MEALLILALISFVLHVVWERAHIVLYSDYEQMRGRLPVYLWASLGDVMYTLLAIILVSFFKGSTQWFLIAGVADYIGLAILGFYIAAFVEYKAASLGRWKYTQRMPLFLGLGVTPLVQMTVLLPLTVYITMSIMHRIA